MSHGRDPACAEAIVCTVTEEASMCFAHSGTPGDALHVQAGVGVDAAEAFTALAETDGLGSVEVTGSGTPDTVVAPRGERVLDGFSRVLHKPLEP